jgi:hypothetical protein
VNLELSREEVRILLSWAEESTRGKFGLGDDASALSWEEETLMNKLKQAAHKE